MERSGIHLHPLWSQGSSSTFTSQYPNGYSLIQLIQEFPGVPQRRYEAPPSLPQTHRSCMLHRGGGTAMDSTAQHLVRTSQEENAIPLVQLGPGFTFMDAHLDYCQDGVRSFPGPSQAGVFISPGTCLCLRANRTQWVTVSGGLTH